MAAAPLRRGRHCRPERLPSGVRRRGRRAARGGARLGAAVDRRSARHARGERHRLPQHAGRGARCRRRALRLRGVVVHVRRPSGAAQGRGPDRPAALAVRGHQVSERALRRRVRALLRLRDRGAALLQRVRPAAGSGGGVRGGDPEVGRDDARRQRRSPSTATARPRATSATSTTSCRRTCSPPPSPTRAAIGQVYNVAVGGRLSLNDLAGALRDLLRARHPALAVPPPRYQDFREGDVRHSQADIGKATRLLGYAPTHGVREGLAEAMPWYESRAARDRAAPIRAAGD